MITCLIVFKLCKIFTPSNYPYRKETTCHVYREKDTFKTSVLRVQLGVQYLHQRIAIDSTIVLNPSLVLNVAAAAVGNTDVILFGEVRFDTASASFTKYTAQISCHKPDYSASFIVYV
ncbi:mitochondrial outer membrane protein porin 4 [Tanacetum coccineum]